MIDPNLPPHLQKLRDAPPTLRQPIRAGNVPLSSALPYVASPAPASAADPSASDAPPPDAYVGREKDLHVEFERDMTRRGVHLIHAHTHTTSTIEPGLPDYHCLFSIELPGWTGGMITRGCAIEFKRAGGSLSPTQREKIAEMRKLGIPVKVCWTLHDAIAFCREHLGC